MPGPLHGVKIVDLSAVVAGPMATCLLADQGADVIKVEPLGLGDLARWLGPNRKGVGAMFATMNRNKRSIALNLKAPEGRAVVLDLVKDADLFVQNFRPGAIQRMGLGYDVLKDVNPGLVYVSMSGFGQDGPYAKRRVYDPVIQATSGFADSQSDRDTGAPHLIQSYVCDKVTALTAAQAMTAALAAKARGAPGQHLTLNMIDAALAFLWPDAFYNHALLDNEAAPSPDMSAFYAVMRAKDGYVTVMTISDDEFSDFCAAVDRADLKADPRFKDVFSRMANAAALREAFMAEIAKWPVADLRAKLEANDVPHAVVLPRDEVFADPQVVHNGTLVETAHPIAGRVRLARPAAEFEATPAGIRTPAPMLGEHTAAILAQIGRTPADIAAMKAAGVIG